MTKGQKCDLLLIYCYPNIRPLFSYINFDLMSGKANKENDAWPKCTVNIYLTCFTGELT